MYNKYLKLYSSSKYIWLSECLTLYFVEMEPVYAQVKSSPWVTSQNSSFLQQNGGEAVMYLILILEFSYPTFCHVLLSFLKLEHFSHLRCTGLLRVTIYNNVLIFSFISFARLIVKEDSPSRKKIKISPSKNSTK